MKKLYYLIGLVLVAIMASCTNEEENLFDQSSANRADASIKENVAILTSAENGWLMKYFPAYQQEYGGYNMIISFEKDGKVKVANELAGPNAVVESYYSVKQSAGILLSFDTYNDLFHAFSDPSAPLGGSKGYGLEGDYDFSIMSASAEKVVLKGRKTEGYAILTPMPADTEWGSYMEKIYEIESKMTFNKYSLKIGDIEIDVIPSDRTLTFNTEENGEEVSIMASYIVTPEGFEFYEPVTILGYEISGFKASDNEMFEEADHSDIVLYPVIPPLTEQFLSGDWFFTPQSMSSKTQEYFEKARKGSESEGEIIGYMYFGTNSNNQWGFCFASGTSAGFYAGIFTYIPTIIDDNTISLQMNGYDNNGAYYYGNCDYDNIRTVLDGTFVLSTDNLRNPNYISFRKTTDPDCSFTIYKNEIYYPYE